MPETTIWTVLPNGFDESGEFLRLTVFVSPRLTTGGGVEELGTFEAFANWPATVAGTPFEIEFDAHGVFPGEPDPHPHALQPDASVWKRVLPPDTPVGTHDFSNYDLSERIVRSFPAGPLAAYLEDFYRTVASTSPTQFGAASTGPISGLVDDLRILAEGDSIVDSLLPPKHDAGMPEARFVDQTAPGAQAIGLGFAQARRFYHRPASTDPLGPGDVPPEPELPDLEFHSIVAFMGDYPMLLRRLALAIDVVIEAGAIAPGVGRVRLVPPSGVPLDDLDNMALVPWTHYRLDDPLFIPRPRFEDRVGDIEDGMIRLEDTELFRVSQIDIDGTALKVSEFAANVGRVQQHLAGKQRSMTADELSVPALRSTGFSVTRLNRAERVVAAFDEAVDRQNRLSHGDEVELFAEDVTRGFHVDVLDKDEWRSLCSRAGTYDADGDIPLPPDEGFVKAASVSEEADVGQGPPDDLYLHESLFGWDGWSLVAKRPGQPVLDQGAGPPDTKQTDATPLATSFEPQLGSLPSLRYARPYVFRARTVDLAGNRVAERAINDEHNSERTHFWRFEPVPSPEVLPRRPFTEGESVLRMVVRSTLGVSTDDYVALARISGLAGHDDALLAYTAENERHLAAPKTSQQMAEWHGKFDDAFGPGATSAAIDQQFQIATRADGTFMDTGIGAVVFQPSGAPPTDLTDPNREKGDPLEPGEYVLQTADLLDMPYLPDVFSRGWSMTGLPGGGSTETFPWTGSWPDVQPIRIELSEGAAGFSLDGRVLSVSLPKAEIAEIRLSSYLDDTDVGQMGIFRLVYPDPAGPVTPGQAAYRAAAVQGLNWLLTPYQTLVLVHAVEKPLEPPSVNVPSVGVTRRSGETFAVLQGTIGNHAKSTGRLDVDAVWTEPIDDPTADTWETVDGAGHVGDFLIERTEDAAKVGRDDSATTSTHRLRHEFGDTKHRVVEYTATATTRYREYFPPEITDQSDLITHVGPTATLSVPSSRRPDPPEVLYIVPTFTHTSGSSRFPSLPLLARTTRVATATGAKIAGRVGRVAGARPLDARLAAGESAVFTTPQVTNTWQRRSGGGLRVYLDRPWFSSGEGELLGVVIKRQPWIHWPVDAAKGLTVTAAARLDAIRFAEAVFDNQLARPLRGTSHAEVSERLLRVLETTAAEGAGLDEVRTVVRSELSLEPIVSTAEFDRWVDVLLPKGDSSFYESRWGKDPIWGSQRADAGPTVSQFPLRTAVGYKVALEETFADVTVVGHTPEFDPVRRLWFCDIDIDAGDAYTPFVKLGLVRYQPDSIPGHHISRVVMADFIQLMPERVLTHSRRGTSLSVTLQGPGGYSREAERALGPIAAAGPAGLSRSRFAEIQLERSSSPEISDLSWVPVGDPVRLSIHANSTTKNVVYTGSITVPRVKRGASLRIAVREFDILPTDASEADAVLVDGPIGILPRFRIEKHRLVYAAHITP